VHVLANDFNDLRIKQSLSRVPPQGTREAEMPRLNGKFVSKAVFEAAMAEQEESTMSEFENDVDVAADEVSAADKRKGQRPGTALKRARIALVKAQSKADDAQRKLNAFDHGRDELQAAVDAAQVLVNEAAENVDAEAAAL
jgi:hypothetical protein